MGLTFSIEKIEPLVNEETKHKQKSTFDGQNLKTTS